VWTFSERDQKTNKDKLKNTYYHRIRAEDKAKNKKYCKVKGMGIERFKKTLNRERNEYIESINHLHHDKAVVRNDPYHACTALQLFRMAKWKEDTTLVGDIKTQKLFAERACLCKEKNERTTAAMFAKDKAKQKYGCASSSKMNKGTDGNSDALED
jgi:hypothetical protein